MASEIKLGVSLFSMGYEYASGKLDLEGCIRAAWALGYTGFELVSAQMVPGYPAPSGAWCDYMARLIRLSGLEPVAYGSYVDLCRYSDRNLNENEIYELVFSDMVIAARLGFRILKVNDLIGCSVLRRLIPPAQKLGLWIGVELHQPNTIHNSRWQPYFQLFAEDKGVHVGVVPDTGIFLTYPHDIFRREMMELGISGDAYTMALDCFSQKERLRPGEIALLPEPVRRCFERMCREFSPTPMADFEVMLRYSRYMHGKFFCVDENLQDHSIDFKTIVNVMKRCGLKGYICAEYEGYFHDITLDGMEQLDRYRRMMQGILLDIEKS